MSEEPMTVCVKAVPDAEPDAPGSWVKRVLEDPVALGRDMWERLSAMLPEGQHAVALTTDMRFEGRSGDWLPSKTPPPPMLTVEQAHRRFGNLARIRDGITTWVEVQAPEGLWRPVFDSTPKLIGYKLEMADR